MDLISQDTGRLKKFIKYCNLHLKDSYNLGGSLCEYFYVKNFNLNNVNDYDIVLDIKNLNYLKSLIEISEWRYQGDLRYIGESPGAQQVYRTKLTLIEDVYIVDWIFGHTTNLLQEVNKIQFEGLDTKITSKDLRIKILKKIATNKNQEISFQNKAILRLNSYLNRTIL